MTLCVVMETRSEDEQRMFEEVSRLLGLDGFVVVGVDERGGELDLEVELVAAAGICPYCERPSVEVKERPLVCVRDLPIAGRRTTLCWRSVASAAGAADGRSASPP